MPHTITHHRRAGGLCPVNSGGHCACVAKIPHSQGEGEDQGESHNQMGSSQIIPEMGGNLDREVTPEPTQQDAVDCTVKKGDSARALNIMSAKGTEHLKWHGHIGPLWQPELVFGSGQVR